MEVFKIEGPNKLSGNITPQGAKNEALQVLCAVLLTNKEVIIDNLPDIEDIKRLIELLDGLGVQVNRIHKNCYSFKADNINVDYLESTEFSSKGSAIRGSVMILGPMLARFGKGIIPKPGGDKIGRRKMDTHFIGLQMLGAHFEYNTEKRAYYVSAKELIGAYMLLDEASVTGTANILMAAVLAKGKTEIYHAACEPYIQQLCLMLNSMGAKITGIGTNLLTIEGVEVLNGCTHKCLPDMIEIGSFIGLAAMTQSELTIKNAQPQHLGIIPETFRRLGIKMDIIGDDIYIPAQDIYEVDTYIDGSILTITDAPWPGFTPDLIKQIVDCSGFDRKETIICTKFMDHLLKTAYNESAIRVFGVINPLEVVIRLDELTDLNKCLTHPNHPFKEMGFHQIHLTNNIWIEKDDYSDKEIKGFYRFMPNNKLRLKYDNDDFYQMTPTDSVCSESNCNKSKLIITKADVSGLNIKKIKGCIHWISKSEATKVIYELFTELAPNGVFDSNSVINFLIVSTYNIISVFNLVKSPLDFF
jgi:UDP-N-acetylglucosamine 1-carboxyvinyltransferase